MIKNTMGVERSLAAAVVLLLATIAWFAPVGQATEQEPLMTREIKHISPEEYLEIEKRVAESTKARSISFQFDSVPMGGKFERIVKGPRTNYRGVYHLDRETVLALTLEEALSRYPFFSIPTYMPPHPTTRAIVLISERRDSDEKNFRLIDHMMFIAYDVKVGNQTYEVGYSTSYNEKVWDLELLASLSYYPVFPDRKVLIQTVEVNGREATAIGQNGAWMLNAVHKRGLIGVHSPELPLPELAKIMESLPETQ